MTWRKLLDAHRVEPHKTSRRELDDLRSVVARDLHDASIDELSADARFGIAYSGILALTKMLPACAGYRTKGLRAHQTSFEAIELSMGAAVSKQAHYFDTCRRKRNASSYDVAGGTTETEAQELVQAAREFRETVEAWIAKHHPDLEIAGRKQ